MSVTCRLSSAGGRSRRGGDHHLVADRCAIALAAGILALILANPSIARAREVAVKGTWQQLINCAPTSYNPLTKQLTCIGSSLWQGAWNGTTSYTFQGTYDLITGNNEGVVHEVFCGTASDGTSGKLTFIEQETLDGATGKFHIGATILNGTGGFSGSTGSVTFDGADNVVTGSGTYAGIWRRPGNDASKPSATHLHWHPH